MCVHLLFLLFAANSAYSGLAPSVPADGELPPELAKHDPKLIEQVCNIVHSTSCNECDTNGIPCRAAFPASKDYPS
jgi:hypothetical protein